MRMTRDSRLVKAMAAILAAAMLLSVISLLFMIIFQGL